MNDKMISFFFFFFIYASIIYYVKQPLKIIKLIKSMLCGKMNDILVILLGLV